MFSADNTGVIIVWMTTVQADDWPQEPQRWCVQKVKKKRVRSQILWAPFLKLVWRCHIRTVGAIDWKTRPPCPLLEQNLFFSLCFPENWRKRPERCPCQHAAAAPQRALFAHPRPGQRLKNDGSENVNQKKEKKKKQSAITEFDRFVDLFVVGL